MKTRQTLFAGFSLFISAGILYYLWSKVSFDTVFGTIRRIPLSWFMLFVFCSICMSLFRTWRYSILLSASSYTPRLSALFFITLVRNFFSDLLPARLGTLIYVYLVRTRLNIAWGPAFSSFAYAFLFDLIALSLMLLPVVLIAGFSVQSALVLVAIGLLLGVVSLAIMYVLPPICDRIACMIQDKTPVAGGRLEKFATLLGDTADHLRFSQEKRIYWKVLALSIAVRLCKYIGMYFLLVGLVVPFGYSLVDFPFLKVFPGMCAAEMAASLPISGIAGFGIYEGTWAMVFQFLGYPENIAVVTSLSHHLITQVYGYSLGALAILVLLLPIFSQHDEQPDPKRIHARYFWLKFFTFSAAMSAVIMFFVPAGSKQPNELITVPLTEAAAPGKTGLPVQGRLVYQTEEGVALKYLETDDDKLLVPGGRYPRWNKQGDGFGCIVGKSIVYIDLTSGRRQLLAQADEPGALVFTSNALIYSDGNQLKKIELATGDEIILPGKGRLLEFGIDRKANVLAATRKTFTGYAVDAYYLPEFTTRLSEPGCSASVSPDGKWVSVNSKNHRQLSLISVVQNRTRRILLSSNSQRYDNQCWTNHPDWIVATAEGKRHDIFLQSVVNGSQWRLTFSGDSDRGDLFITGQYR